MQKWPIFLKSLFTPQSAGCSGDSINDKDKYKTWRIVHTASDLATTKFQKCMLTAEQVIRQIFLQLTLQTNSSWVFTSMHRYSELPSTWSSKRYLSATTVAWKGFSLWLGINIWSLATRGTRHSVSGGCVIAVCSFLTTSPPGLVEDDDSTVFSTPDTRALNDNRLWTFCILTCLLVHTITHTLHRYKIICWSPIFYYS